MSADSRGEHVELSLYLPDPRYLNIQLSIDIVEMCHHLVEHIVLLIWSAQSFRAARSGLAD